MAVVRCSSRASFNAVCSQCTTPVHSESAAAAEKHTRPAYLTLMTVTYCKGSTCEELKRLTPATCSSSLLTECRCINISPCLHIVSRSAFPPCSIKGQKDQKQTTVNSTDKASCDKVKKGSTVYVCFGLQ